MRWRDCRAELAHPEVVSAAAAGADGLVLRPVPMLDHPQAGGLRTISERLWREVLMAWVEDGQVDVQPAVLLDTV
eukprot:CAMPEP_0180824012 /NCGR_PEP_ID=MMETSP1038_2-20121128/72219_1 /TAXON_ID=632150 /ORGANISM="Azadinium spinosum, Strain 3D9" /LENGTH=74 /DNA_ID=CAMNT_0022866397 /DNA_START=42 /DNA_END=262 /DNA_ORIENTATION=+